MSLGLGRIQRECLRVIDGKTFLDSIEVAGLIFGKRVLNDAEVVSVRRALRSLAAAGKIADMGRGYRDGRKRWTTPERAKEYDEKLVRAFGPRAARR